MFSWPELGTRVTLRYRRAKGSVPPLTDAVGHLLAVEPSVRVRTKTGAVVEVAADDVVALRVLTDAPVRTSQIRALEHAAAAATPGRERAWLEGWLLRAGEGVNYAVPLDVSATAGAIPAIEAWYERRGLTARLAIPDRLLPLPPGVSAQHTERVLVRDVSASTPVEPATGGELALARATVTDAPDGTRWVGLSPTGTADDPATAAACEALLAWAAARGATRGYLVVPGTASMALADALGFRAHHRRRYFPARSLGWDTV
ncbi:GCN5 family acetyltransferase [Mycobacterium sp. 852002-51613_SCH5001154]|uniref:GNAT family N-acetyltransferase, cg3035/Rv0428c family n=1 Tax=Mycobacterium sp. 852002-51613_SCH5001154 TaxID=1834104 RepID=UPI000802321E|nr:GCN5 family acetyltransferase [Mycobacterium sp. 852002-51613_SCH5001154]OBF76234.1 GCN5 family acetyltransferase [Mycobacterium sp. 852002-51613_SCH5001154]